MSDDTARRVDAAVAAVSGVEEAYLAAPAAARVLRRLTDDDAPLASVRGAAVTVSIGVQAASDSADVAERVAAAVRTAGSEPFDVVRVRVSRLIPAD